jgi:hypothetical protein
LIEPRELKRRRVGVRRKKLVGCGRKKKEAEEETVGFEQ